MNNYNNQDKKPLDKLDYPVTTTTRRINQDATEYDDNNFPSD